MAGGAAVVIPGSLEGSEGKGAVCKMLTWREYYHGLGGEVAVSRGAASGGFKVSAGGAVIGRGAPDSGGDWRVQT